MPRFFVIEETKLKLTGDTFSVKEPLKSLGGRWDSGARCWVVQHSEVTLEKLSALGFIPLGQPEVAPQSDTSKGGVDQALERTWSVTDLVSLLDAVVRKTFRESLWISGEASSVRMSNGHLFFDISESQENSSLSMSRTASISCSLWNKRRLSLLEKHGEFEISDGLKLRLLVHCDFRVETSRICLVVEDIDLEFAKGALALSRAKVVAELRKRGLYDLNKQRNLVPFPLRIALITAHQSRAHTDFFDELRRSMLAFKVTLFDANMQGESTSHDVSKALQVIGEQRRYDCVVITRGGGSRLDLRWFDDFDIAKAIAHTQIPVITAIGHFDDVSVADEISFKAEKTPTGAARYLVEHICESLARFDEVLAALSRRSAARLSRERVALARFEELALAKVKNRLSLEKTKLQNAEQTLRVLQHSMSKTLERGFSLLHDESGKVLMGADFLAEPERTFVAELALSEKGGKVRVKARALSAIPIDEKEGADERSVSDQNE